ncbi:MAG: hypothetical protein BWK80_43715 [Desulfobacteraceae bacterium IS3]|nr:MAG: hypothetical protein BWK80_43715 [Desulfobacteraceae bacterium IS3]
MPVKSIDEFVKKLLNRYLLTLNIIVSLGNSLQNSSRLIFLIDIKIQIDRDNHYVYPDISVLCGDIESCL